jgi:hypothetical protein
MSVQYVCPGCSYAVRVGQMRGQLCASCTRKQADAAAQEAAKTAMADDLVRGKPK